MRKMGRWIGAALTLLLCCAWLAPAALGYERIDTARTGSFQVTYQDAARRIPLAGMALRLYRAAEVSETAAFTAVTGFAPARVDLSQSQSDWSAAAATLAAYALAHTEDVAPALAAQGTTDDGGTFRAEQLQPGLYLLMGEQLTAGSYTYAPVPCLVMLPQLHRDTDAWQYDVRLQVEQKFTRTHERDDPDPDPVSVQVKKIWRDSQEAARPAKIQVELYRDGRLYDTAELNAGNGWQYRWTGLSRGGEWTLTEQVPDGYTVLVERDADGGQIAFTVTNTAEPGTPPEDPPGPPPSVPPQTPDTPDDPDTARLPQTGALWRPVIVLTAAGLGLLAAGWALKRRDA